MSALIRSRYWNSVCIRKRSGSWSVFYHDSPLARTRPTSCWPISRYAHWYFICYRIIWLISVPLRNVLLTKYDSFLVFPISIFLISVCHPNLYYCISYHPLASAIAPILYYPFLSFLLSFLIRFYAVLVSFSANAPRLKEPVFCIRLFHFPLFSWWITTFHKRVSATVLGSSLHSCIFKRLHVLRNSQYRESVVGKMGMRCKHWEGSGDLQLRTANSKINIPGFWCTEALQYHRVLSALLADFYEMGIFLAIHGVSYTSLEADESQCL